MSGLKGIAKNLTASFSSHFVSVLQQVALTPLLVHAYGIAGFGEWQALSASVSYLGTLDFGIQTYVVQDLTVRYHRGEMEQFRLQQSTALRLLLGIVLVAATLATLAFALPIEHWLKMDGSGSGPAQAAHTVRGAVFLLALTVLLQILFGFFSGHFMVLSRNHVGYYWTNAKNACMILFPVPVLLMHGNFFYVALAQVIAVVSILAAMLCMLFRSGRKIFPTLRYWDGSIITAILGPSAYFALIFFSNFLVYQLPVLMIERGAGPVAVAIFTVMRTIFSMTRNVMNSFTQSMAPEVTALYARNEWPRLARLYDYSERLVFALIPIANIGTLFLCPLLLTLWLHRPQLFVPGLYILCAAVSIVMSAKEHKFQFQFSTNTHRELARFMFGMYLALVAAWFFLIPRFGINGLLWAWFTVEIIQVLYIMHLNSRFFAGHELIDVKYPVRLTLLSVAFLAGTMYLLPRSATLPLLEQAALAIGVGLVLFGLDVPIFGLIPIWGSVRGRLQRKFARAT